MRALIALSLCLPFGCFAAQWNKHYDVPGTPEVHISGGNVPVEVHSGTSSGVDVELKTREMPIGPNDAHIEAHQEGNRLELRVVVPPTSGWHHDNSVGVKVTVPRNVNVSVRTENGPIRVEDITGSLHVSTQNGPTDVRALVGQLDIQKGNGPVSAQGRFTGLDLRMENGPLDLRAEAGSKLESNWRIQAENGPISIRLPHDLRADLSLHTGNGPHSFDLPGAHEGDKHDMHAKLNGGGPALEIHTENGPFSISQD